MGSKIYLQNKRIIIHLLEKLENVMCWHFVRNRTRNFIFRPSKSVSFRRLRNLVILSERACKVFLTDITLVYKFTVKLQKKWVNDLSRASCIQERVLGWERHQEQALKYIAWNKDAPILSYFDSFAVQEYLFLGLEHSKPVLWSIKDFKSRRISDPTQSVKYFNISIDPLSFFMLICLVSHHLCCICTGTEQTQGTSWVILQLAIPCGTYPTFDVPFWWFHVRKA